MTIDKRPSGSYRIREMVDGKIYSVTVDHKPTQKEARTLISELISKKDIISSKMLFKQACGAYIESRSNLLSPSSIRGYKGIIRQISDRLLRTPIGSITKPMIQTEVNNYSANHSPKSTYNFSGFIISVLNFYGNEIGKITLPQKEKKSPYIPTEEEVHAIYEAVKDTKYYVPLLLAGNGLRRSEICALQPNDLNGCYLTINKAKVQNENKEWVIKSTKTTESTRVIKLNDTLVKIINERGITYDGHPELIYRKLTETQKKLGIQHFPLHKMRHFYASYMHKLGIPSKIIQHDGGWKTDSIMKTVYTHAMEDEEQQAIINSALEKLI